MGIRLIIIIQKVINLTIFLLTKRVSTADVFVTVGQLSLIYDDIGEETFPVNQVIIHPDFDNTLGLLKHNLALLEVKYTKRNKY